MGKPVVILHLIKSLGRGGAEMLLPETLKLHDQEKFRFHYAYFLPWKDQMVEALELNGGSVTCFNASGNIQMMVRIPEVIRFVKREKVEIIHAHLPWAGIVARIVGKVTGVKVIYTEHNKLERYHFITRMLNLATMNWLSAIVAVSEDVQKSVRTHKKKVRSELVTILNGVNVEHFRPDYNSGVDVREELGIPKDAIVIGTIAVFRFQKRLDIWLTLAQEIRHRLPMAHFIVVGDGPLKQMLMEKRASMGMEKYVHLPGIHKEVRPYLRAFDIYMMSSVFEGLPIALLEAMASGCAVITTDAGGIKQVVRHEVDGLVCEVDEPEKLVDMASDLVEHQHRRQELALGARKRVEESFNMKQMVHALEQLYNRFSSHI